MNIILRIIAFSIVLALPLSCTHRSRKNNRDLQKQTSNIYDSSKYDYSVKVTRILDGDTFEAISLCDKIELVYRIYAIDAPEEKQPYGAESEQFLSELINDKTVHIKIQKKRDGYGRPVVWVYTQDGRDISAEMLKAGMAWHFKKYDTSKEYEDLEKTAKKKRIGLWKDEESIVPSSYRKNKK